MMSVCPTDTGQIWYARLIFWLNLDTFFFNAFDNSKFPSCHKTTVRPKLKMSIFPKSANSGGIVKNKIILYNAATKT